MRNKKTKRELTLSAEDANKLDMQIQEMALLNWELFCKTFNIDKTQAFVCFEIQKKKSLQQIGIKLGVGRNAVFAISKKCPDKQRTKKAVQ